MKRDSKYELLRIVLIFMVITVHYLNPEMGGALKYSIVNKNNHIIALLLESVGVIAVNVFIILAGFFGNKRMSLSLRKSIGLILYVIGYNFVFRMIDFVIGAKEVSMNAILGIFIPANWYIILYIALIVVAPYINYLIKHITQKQFKYLIGVMIITFSLWNSIFDMADAFFNINMVGISTITSNGSQGGYNIVNFVLLYLIGAYLHMYSTHVKVRKLLVYYTVFLVITCIMGNYSYVSWNYDNIFVVFMSVILFMIWNQSVKVGEKSSINIIAKGTLGVYIIHTKDPISQFLWGRFSIAYAAQSSIWIFLLNMITCVLVTFIICYVFDVICRSVAKPITKLLNRCQWLTADIIDLKTTE